MKAKELLKIGDLAELARKQQTAILMEVEETFENLMHHLRNNNLAQAEKLLADSPAGDEMGCNNNYIDFSHVVEGDRDGSDIGTVINKLREISQHLK